MKFGLLESTVVSMPDDKRNAGDVASSVYSKYVKKRDRNSLNIQDVLSAPIRVEQMTSRSEKDGALKRVKRQKYESEAFQKLHDEYATLYERMKPNSLPSFLQEINRSRLQRL